MVIQMIEKKNTLKPIIIGGMVMDMRGQPMSKLKLQTSNPGILRQIPGGVGRNICENLFRLKCNPLIISAVGDDLIGDALFLHGKNLGLDLQGIYKLDDQSTAIYTAILDEFGDLHTAIADMTIFDQLNSERILAFADQISQTSIVIVDTNLPRDSLVTISEFCIDKQIPLWIEPVSIEKSKKVTTILENTTYISPNINELGALADKKVSSLADIYTASQILLNKGVQNLLVTLGSDGVILANATGFHHFPAIPTSVVDVTGAGDAFVAGTIFGLLQDRDIYNSIPYGLITAKLTIQTTETVSSAINPRYINRIYQEVYKK